MKAVALIQARYDSSRLPGKVLEDIARKPALAWVVAAARAIPAIDQVVVCTSNEPSEDPIEDWCNNQSVDCFRGSKDDVLLRLKDSAQAFDADIIMRLTADCPFLDPQVCDQVLYLLNSKKLDYAGNAHPSTWPDGLDCEVMTRATLERAAKQACFPSEREHVTPYIRAHKVMFKQDVLVCPLAGLQKERWTLDNPADLKFLNEVATHIPENRPPSYTEILSVLDQNPEIRNLNRHIPRDQASKKILVPDVEHPQFSKKDYSVSKACLERAEKLIPSGTQTFSKSKLIFPPSKAPLFLTHGLGARVWDVDGNSYVDNICALLPNVLGYCDPDVDSAIRSQLGRGISFSLATELEAQLAEQLQRLIPCAEMVRFGKNGTDATSGAIRLARAFTGRDHIAVCGYHGWQDWYIGSTTRHKGVPRAVRDLTHKFPYNDIPSLEALFQKYKGKIASVIMEPASFIEPEPGYLEQVKQLAHDNGALLIFDEVVSGFRFAIGGAQELFGVVPDLSAFGKGMANGMPISAIVGRKDVMLEMEQVFYSGTFGGEALSLAAAIATIDKFEREGVIAGLWSYGDRLSSEVTRRIKQHGLEQVLAMSGFAPWMQLAISPPDPVDAFAIRTYLMRNMLDRGVLMVSTHNISHAHNDTTMALTLDAYDRVLPKLAEVLYAGNIEAALDCKKIQPVFEVRKN